MPEITRPTPSVVARLSFLDRFLPLWIFLAMALGLGLVYVAMWLRDRLWLKPQMNTDAHGSAEVLG